MHRIQNILPLALVSFLAVSCTAENEEALVFLIALGFAAVLTIGIVIWVLVDAANIKRKNRNAIALALANRKDFTESRVVHKDGEFYVATDESRRKVFCVQGFKQTLLFDYADVVSVEVSVDGETLVVKKSLPLSTVGAFVGDAAIGGRYGSFVGALAFGNSTERRVGRITVHVLLRNQPVQSLHIELICNCSDQENQVSYMIRYNEAKQNAQELYDMFRLVIDTADRDRSKGASTVKQLKELAKLHKEGSLTDEEFAKLKGEIIGKAQRIALDLLRFFY